mgnify:CR=1 FL=1
MKKMYIIGGGTVNKIAPHLQLCSYASGNTADELMGYTDFPNFHNLEKKLILTRMAQGNDSLYTVDQLRRFIEELVAFNDTKIIIMTAAICDFAPSYLGSERLRSDKNYDMTLYGSQPKIIDLIRRERKDIFLVSFKQTHDADVKKMFELGLKQCKRSSSNLVFVNDSETRKCMIVTPEESSYCYGWERSKALRQLMHMTSLRSNLSFTRSTVVSGESVSWLDDRIPFNLRQAVNHCIKKGAYKVFNGSTVGHFAVKIDSNRFLTSIRGTNFNQIEQNGLVEIVTDGPDNVIAYGSKPSVGGQSQRIIFDKYPDMDCILHFHCPNKVEMTSVSQFAFECGSHECGQNAADGLIKYDEGLYCVNITNHGPNIVFNKDYPLDKLLSFIDHHFDLTKKTVGYTL